MSSALPIAPFDGSRYIGTVTLVTPTTVLINLPRAITASSRHHAGFDLEAGRVGEFILIEGDEYAVLGRISEVRLPERDRLKVEPYASGSEEEANPVGSCQLLSSLSLLTGSVVRGIPQHPRIGQHVFSAHPLMVKHAVENSQSPSTRTVPIARVPHAAATTVSFSPSALFGRHLAVLGATGGGKSWTVARLCEGVARLRGKSLLFDATGEFHTLRERTRHLHLGGQPVAGDPRVHTSMPYTHLTDLDLFAMFQPSTGVQGPKLREALRSLKLAALEPRLATNGVLTKANRPRADLEAHFLRHAQALRAPDAAYDIEQLAAQIQAECVWPTDRANSANYGGALETELGYVNSLVVRINLYIGSPQLDCIFRPAGLEPLTQAVASFLEDPDTSILRVNLELLPFEHNTREIVVNAIGRYLLNQARSGRFRQRPLLTVLDEAHQFLGRAVGDEMNRLQLDAFGLIAKEGRKFGLTCLLSTQRPRDIPEDVLSQFGMFIVHRLINERDRQIVEKACGNMDASAAAFLPTLMEGEAIIIGIDSPMPMPLMINAPEAEPASRGPDYERGWVAGDDSA